MEILVIGILMAAVGAVFVLQKMLKASYERQIATLQGQIETERAYAKRMIDLAKYGKRKRTRRGDEKRKRPTVERETG